MKFQTCQPDRSGWLVLALGIPSFFPWATMLPSFSTVPQLLPMPGLASGSHPELPMLCLQL